ncbi:fimbrillin family protein [Bacteroides sp. 51]|uniref:fimbrillin family protein n=1 Tax=Bacteroides sp. 51 TaxID=2302938 RepID=UPI0013D89DDD|nr:fimbrillin family protein [Bacteroides sp. 51]NDV82844.1 hypothetical protein [Bacteroides sp. 51]
MRKLFLIVTTLAFTLASCSNDEVLDTTNNMDGSIEFRTLTDKGTRAAITDENSILSFTVSGIKMTKEATPTSDGYLFDAFGITRGEDSNWDYTPKRYWPKDRTVDFYAYSPSSSKNVTYGIKGYDATSNNSIAYTVPQISNKDAQEDFLVARITKQDGGLDGKVPVKLNFHHALSRVMFFARTTQKNVTYTIDEIELVNLYESGMLDLTNTRIEESGGLKYTTALQPWGNTGAHVNYTVDMGKSPIYLLNDYASVLGETGAVMVLPQKTELSTTGKTAPATDKFAIRVNYKAFVDDIYYAGSADKSETKYFAVKDPTYGTSDGITFEMGRQYNFYLEFGDEVGEAISFEVGVSEWSDAPASYLPEMADYSHLLSADLITEADGKGTGGIVDGKITKTELEAVTSITASKVGFNFKGIEYFTRLQTLSIAGVTADLDASKNTQLTTVSISGSTLGTVNLSNGVLTTLTISGTNTITSLNASNNKLTSVPSVSGISTLNLSNNRLAGAIEIKDGSFKDLNLSNNAITTLKIPRVSTSGVLDLKGNTTLNQIEFKDDSSSITQDFTIKTLDVSDCLSLNKENGIYLYYGVTINTLKVWKSWDKTTGNLVLGQYSGEVGASYKGRIGEVTGANPSTNNYNPYPAP